MKLNKLEFWLMNNHARHFIQERIELPAFLKAKIDLKGKKILELGCGNGYGARLLNLKYQPSIIHGIDLDQKMITRASNKYGYIKELKFKVGDIANLPYQKAIFDAVFDFGVLHHLVDWKKAISEASRVLKPGGYIFIEDFSIESFNYGFGKLFRKLFVHPYTQMYSQIEFRDFLENNFTTVQLATRKICGVEYIVFIGQKTS